MPGVPKHAKASKRRPASKKNGETAVKRKKSKKLAAPAADGSGSSGQQLRLNGRLRPSLAELERMFEEDDDDQLQVNNYTNTPGENNGLLDNQNAPFEPTLEKLEQLFEGDGVVEIQVINSANPNDAQLLFEGHGGVLLPSRAAIEHMFEERNDVELQVINPNEDSSDALGFE